MTTRVKRSAKPAGIEVLVGMDQELLKGLVQEALQEVWETHMTEALGVTMRVRAGSGSPRARPGIGTARRGFRFGRDCPQHVGIPQGSVRMGLLAAAQKRG